MNEYHKIQSIYKRDERGNMLFGEYSLPEFDYLKDNYWVFTEKVDGTNIRLLWRNGELEIRGKTDRAQIYAPLISAITHLIDKAKMAELFPFDACLYGEGYGAKIQKGGERYLPDGVSFVLFDVNVNGIWLERENVADIAQRLSIQIAPIIGGGPLGDMVECVREGFKSRWGDFVAEGIVARPRVELVGRRGNRIITKIKHKDFKGVEK